MSLKDRVARMSLLIHYSLETVNKSYRKLTVQTPSCFTKEEVGREQEAIKNGDDVYRIRNLLDAGQLSPSCRLVVLFPIWDVYDVVFAWGSKRAE